MQSNQCWESEYGMLLNGKNGQNAELGREELLNANEIDENEEAYELKSC